jgi:phenylpropionate dioxygenase-like ring-hydroxylating dioxygenase large terminal subunit
MNEIGRASASLAALAPRIKDAWYVIAMSHEVTGTPIVRALYGVPITVFRRPDGSAAALLDRCPHRNVPLSGGKVVEGDLQCPYHGWRFAADGRCTAIPGLDGPADHPARRATAYPVREQQGFVWVWGEPDKEPVGEPFRFRLADDPAYLTVRREVRTRGSVHAVVENALDVPHTAFLHGGLFREDRKDRRPIRCVIQRHQDRVECEFIGESRPTGLAGRILSPSGGMVTHFDRFFLPSITEVEYRIGDENHIVLNGACTPVDDWDTRLYAVVCIRTRLPRWLVRLAVQPLAMHIFGQDAVVLKQQADALHSFGEASYASTDIDLLGPHILRLMTRAARGEPVDPNAPPYVRETTLLV